MEERTDLQQLDLVNTLKIMLFAGTAEFLAAIIFSYQKAAVYHPL